jgi:hypothetical protein
VEPIEIVADIFLNILRRMKMSNKSHEWSRLKWKIGNCCHPFLFTEQWQTLFFSFVEKNSAKFVGKKSRAPQKVSILCRDHLESLNWPHLVIWQGRIHNTTPHLQHRCINS